MAVKMLLTVVFIFLLSMSDKIFTAQKERDTLTNEKNVFYAKKDEAQLKELQEKRDSFLKIYNRYPADLNELISKGLLNANYINNDFGSKVSISNGVISLQTKDGEMNDLLIKSNKKILESEGYRNTSENLRIQRKIINQIVANDTDSEKIINYSNIVKTRNTDLGMLKTSELSRTKEDNQDTINKIDGL